MEWAQPRRVIPRSSAAWISICVVGLILAITATPARAGGGALVQDGDLDVTSQQVVSRFVDGQATMLINFQVTGEVAADSQPLLLIATPTSATIGEATAEEIAAFDDIQAASSPTVVEESQWWPEFGDDTPAEVTATVSTRDLREEGIQSLGAAGSDAVLAWLAGKGISLSSAEALPIRNYGDAGWSFGVVRFDPPVGDGTTTVGLPLLRVEFGTEEPVVPLLMAASSEESYQLRTSMVAAERMDRTDAMRGTSTIDFAGEVSAQQYPSLAGWLEPLGGSAWVTTVSQTFDSPNRITEDLRFAPSSYGAVSAGTEVEMVPRIIFGIPAGLVLVFGGLVLIAVAGIVISLWLQRRAGLR